MSQSLTQEQKAIQRQIATQQTIRLMQLVELPYISLEQEIHREVDENPALEVYSDDVDDRHQDREDDYSAPAEYDDNGNPLELSGDQLPDDEIFKEDYYRDDDMDDYPTERDIENSIRRANAPDDSVVYDRQGVYAASLQENWQIQLGEMEMDERQKQIADYLVGTLDDAGYLNSDVQTIANELLFMENLYTNAQEVEQVLTTFVQELDPPGTGARDLKECLLLQLRRLPDQTSAVRTATDIVSQCFNLFLKKRYDKIREILNLTENAVKEAVAVIKKLSPRPADDTTPLQKSAEIIHPDFTITAHDGVLSLSLNNQYVPKVRLNKEFSNEYRFLSKEESAKKREEAERFMKTYVDKANQFIGALSTREMILYNTMYAIMNHQRDYFLTGDDTKLKPMILKTIADEVNLDISTISRVSNSKYVQTDFGIIPLKHLFSEAVNKDNVSSKAIKSLLSDLIAKEDKSKPLSDDRLNELLEEKGYKVARRTIAKYREQLGIPVARLRVEK